MLIKPSTVHERLKVVAPLATERTVSRSQQKKVKRTALTGNRTRAAALGKLHSATKLSVRTMSVINSMVRMYSFVVCAEREQTAQSHSHLHSEDTATSARESTGANNQKKKAQCLLIVQLMGITTPFSSLTITRSVWMTSFVSMKTTDVGSNGSVRTPRLSMKDLQQDQVSVSRPRFARLEKGTLSGLTARE